MRKTKPSAKQPAPSGSGSKPHTRVCTPTNPVSVEEARAHHAAGGCVGHTALVTVDGVTACRNCGLQDGGAHGVPVVAS